MAILVTGYNGFVGRVFTSKLLDNGHKVYGVARHLSPSQHNLIPLEGDILEPNLGLKRAPRGIEAIYHIAGIHRLGEDKDGSIWKTNVDGTKNVLDFTVKHGIPRLYFVSTAYTWECNTYGLSKIKNEQQIKEYAQKYGLKTIIFKPSVIIGTAEHPYPGHVSQFVSLVIKAHQSAEVIRRWFESQARLPPIRPLFRVKGNPEGNLNLIPVDAVAQAMVDIQSEGTYWLTNPRPPKLKQLAEWISEFTLLDFKIEKDFVPSTVEKAFNGIITPFSPYLEGDNFPSNVGACPPVTRDFVEAIVRRLVGL